MGRRHTKKNRRINESLISSSAKCHTRKLNGRKVLGGVIFEQRLE